MIDSLSNLNRHLHPSPSRHVTTRRKEGSTRREEEEVRDSLGRYLWTRGELNLSKVQVRLTLHTRCLRLKKGFLLLRDDHATHVTFLKLGVSVLRGRGWGDTGRDWERLSEGKSDYLKV
ncbi:hypothetical protein E2C01_102748 [Portunus trituberculatus]|uniref:Uncharacterized protein n=1 Tax=Portunus trituberculatus TaxID=210409 RepID=A0A5B7KJ36_PORTR|nr:hypothetical protein [Portunus trituberculatus]